MTYQIWENDTDYTYIVLDTKTNSIVGRYSTLDEANIMSWQSKKRRKRFQILANCFNGAMELTWYEKFGNLVIPNGYPTIEKARRDIVKDLKELCFNNDYLTHPNPEGDYSIIDTFTSEEVAYKISEEEASHPCPLFLR
ncbi:hypothetical protein ACTJJ0_22205 [Chitinophaga sp. 22321]|uniref:hypothetical protein n=1 Tax=Chitinophaga sp. 22321 TaxID=3453909 RepID=UPI003F833BC4